MKYDSSKKKNLYKQQVMGKILIKSKLEVANIQEIMYPTYRHSEH